jgi:hypothetical protein
MTRTVKFFASIALVAGIFTAISADTTVMQSQAMTVHPACSNPEWQVSPCP